MSRWRRRGSSSVSRFSLLCLRWDWTVNAPFRLDASFLFICICVVWRSGPTSACGTFSFCSPYKQTSTITTAPSTVCWRTASRNIRLCLLSCRRHAPSAIPLMLYRCGNSVEKSSVGFLEYPYLNFDYGLWSGHILVISFLWIYSILNRIAFTWKETIAYLIIARKKVSSQNLFSQCNVLLQCVSEVFLHLSLIQSFALKILNSQVLTRSHPIKKIQLI